MYEYLLLFAAIVLVERLCAWEEEPKGAWIAALFGGAVLCMLLGAALWFGIMGVLAAFGLRILLRPPRKGKVRR